MIYDRYEQYERRMQVLANILKWIKKYYKTVILPSVAAICITVGFLSVMGTFTEPLVIPDITYGGAMTAQTEAFLSDYVYEYKSAGGTVWEPGLPSVAGTYTVRAISKNGFGKLKYSDEITVVVAPAEFRLECTLDACLYGSEAQLTAENVRAVGLVGDDRLDEGIYTVLSYSDNGVDVKVESFRIIGPDGSDRTSSYKLIPSSDFVTLTPRSIKLVTDSAEKIYDGEPLIGDAVRVVEGTLADGDVIVAEEISITKTGSAEFNPKISIHNKDGDDVTDFYDITFDFGTLSVIPRAIAVSTKTESRHYDGTPLMNDVPEITGDGIAEGETLVVNGAKSITFVGEIGNEYTISIIDKNGEDVTDQYTVTYKFGTLKVTPRPITVTTGSAESSYIGKPISSDKIEITEGSLADGETMQASDPVSITFVGSVENKRTVKIIGKNGSDVSDQYTIKYKYGVLTVNKRFIVVSTGSAEKQYDGTPLSTDEYKISSGTFVSGDSLRIADAPSITDVGRIENVRICTVVTSDGVDITDQYSIGYKNGFLEILPINITISTGSAEKIYDGSPLKNNEYSIVSGELARGETISLSMGFAAVEPGRYENKLEFTIKNASGKETTHNYNITYEYGILEIKLITLKFKTASDSKVYDAVPLANYNYEMISGKLAPGHNFACLWTTGWQLNVGTSSNGLYVLIADGEGNDVTQRYYIIEVEEGTLTVTPRPITITSGSAEKVYDGEPLTNCAHSYGDGERLINHRIDVTYTGSQTRIGESPNTFRVNKIYDFDTEEDVTSNYDITLVFGILKVVESGEDGETVIPVSEETTELSGPRDINSLSGSGGDGVIAEVKLSTKGLSGVIYFRERSYGDYTFSGWGKAPACTSLPINPFFLSGTQALNTSSLYSGQKVNMTVSMRSSALTLVPYYVSYSNATKAGIGKSDVVFSNNSDTYQLQSVVPFATIEQLLGTSSNQSGFMSNYEPTYRQFVYQNYLDIPASTKEAMLQIAADNGLDPNSPTIIEEVKNYISNAATYNLYMPEFPEGVDKAVYFLTVTREGYCQHFASAATLMYRALGIPARYTVGYVAYASEVSDVVDVTIDGGHAWTEVYIDGIGWVPVEVTGGGPGGGMLKMEAEDPETFEVATSEMEEIESVVIAEIYVDDPAQSGTIYLRQRSFGAYDGRGWGAALSCDLNLSDNPFFLSGTQALYTLNYYSGFVTGMNIVLSPDAPELVPYFANNLLASSAGIGGDDVSFDLENKEYRLLEVVPFATYEQLMKYSSVQSDWAKSEEKTYRLFAYQNYLDIPESTKTEMLKLANENGIKAGSKTVIADVQKYITGAATYNLNISDIPEDVDVAVYFLTVSKEGFCQHFASAATLMYRALGIPARFTIGYVGAMEEGNPNVTVSAMNGHAWVEVYIDGVGWVPVEVTPGGGEVGEFVDSETFEIGGPMLEGDGEPVPVAELYIQSPTQSGTIYMRQRSFGDYNFSGWGAAKVCNKLLSHNPFFLSGTMSYFVSSVMSSAVTVTLLDGSPDIVPYYTRYAYAESAGIGGNDVLLDIPNQKYRLSKAYLFVTPDDMLSILSMSNRNSWVTKEEPIYREFVYENYLDIPESTKEVMLQLAKENGINANSSDVIKAVQRYISNAATYNLEIEEFPEGVDKVVYFLTVTKEGYCQHFASAATLMYRALGIPARYTIGYVGYAEEGNSDVTIWSDSGHAWVEVYVDKLGWIPVEVTGGGPGGGAVVSKIGEGMGEPDNTVYAEVEITTAKEGVIYLRSRSYGDYAYEGWRAGEEYYLTSTYNPLFMSGTKASLLSNKFVQNISISRMENCPSLVPYYVTAESMLSYSGNDVEVTLDSLNVVFNRVYPFVTIDGLKSVSRTASWITNQEPAYRNFVYREYLSIPQSTKEAMLKLAKENGLDANSATIISDVQNYIKNVAKYNLDIDDFPEGIDRVVYFLTESKEGYCQHFASAATLMYRALGIPARYTEGFVAKFDEGMTSVTLYGTDAHAWVEIYLDGIGWVPVEVTPPSTYFIEIDGQEVEVDAYGRIIFAIETYNVEKLFDGRPLDEFDGEQYRVTKGMLLNGHTVSLDVSNPLSDLCDPYTIESQLNNKTILDSDGNDVTDQYKFNVGVGQFSIIERPITIQSASATKLYDGSTLVAREWWIAMGGLAEGHSITVNVTGFLRSIGSASNSFSVSIVDQYGNDVTGCYNISMIEGTLTFIE